MKSYVSHSKIFGCLAYVHILEILWKKLDDRSEKCIFVKYSEQLKAYRLYNLVTKEVIVRKDFEFNKYQSWDGQVNEIVDDRVLFLQKDEQVDIARQQVAPLWLPRLQVPRVSSMQDAKLKRSPTLSIDWNHSVSSSRNEKTRSKREIYEQHNNIDQQANFTLLSSQPI